MNQQIRARVKNTFRALRQRNYRLFFIGQGISLIGSWIQNIAMSWLVYSLTNSAMMMGTITFINALPTLFVSPVAGVVIDRVNKYKMLIWLQCFFLLQALTLAVLTLSGVIQVWHIVVIGILTNINAAFDMPLRQSLVINLVSDPKDLSNAISLNSSNFNLARLLGPAIAGVLIARFSEGICFLINAVSYIAVLWALLQMKLNLPGQKYAADKDYFDFFGFCQFYRRFLSFADADFCRSGFAGKCQNTRYFNEQFGSGSADSVFDAGGTQRRQGTGRMYFPGGGDFRSELYRSGVDPQYVLGGFDVVYARFRNGFGLDFLQHAFAADG